MHTQASQHNINAIETLSMFSKNSSIKNVLYSISYWWPMFDITKLPISFYIGGGVLLFFIFYGVVSRFNKYHIILFFIISSVIFIFFSTGTSIESFAPVFITFVTKTPVIGSMFRDPNKLVGLMVVGFAVLLTLGIEKVMMSMEDSYSNFFLKGGIISLVIVSLWFYINPIREEFVAGFYKPIETPKEMEDVQDNFINKNDFFSKVFYFPIADNMAQSYTGIATPYWNKNPNLKGFVKATGDFQIYNSKKNTIFHHEGNIMGITYFINYLQYLMDWGLSRNIGHMLKAFPVDEFAYHDEYLGQEERQDFNLKILSEQEGLEKHYENKIYTLYKLMKPRSYIEIIKKRVYTPYGFSKLESYFGLENFDLKNYAVFFTSQEDGKELLYNLDEGDYLEAENFNDLLLSNLPEKYYSFPFDSVENANIFLGWGKVLVKNNDWLWYLRSHGINNFPFDFDMGKGLLATTATSTVTVPVYKFKDVEGTLVADFDSLLKLNKFFKPDNQDLFSIQANPRKDLNNIPLLRGQVIKGDPKNIWQVAKSGYIKAKENNPYQFNLVVSGRGSNKLHVKVRFYDENLEEIGVSYVVAPKEEFLFDEMNFYGEYISPPNSKYMRMDLLTFQNKNQKNYWWVHDIKIKDMGKYKAKNIFNLEIHENKLHKGVLYVRTLVSKAGGNISIKQGEKEFRVNTKSKSVNRMQWIEVGKLENGSGKIIVENTEGFNGVNAFAFIPDKVRKELEFPLRTTIDKSRMFMAIEAEDSMEYSGEIQTSRNYPKLSGGRGIRSQKGSLKKNIEILKSAAYDLIINMEGIPKNKGVLNLDVISETGEKVFSKKIYSSEFKDNELKSETVIDEDKTSENFSRKYLKMGDTLSHYGKQTIKNIFFEKGKYILEIKFDSKVPSLSSFSDLHKFKPSEFKKVVFLEDDHKESEGGRSECEKISPDMMSAKKQKNIFTIKYDPTCSYDWYIYASKMTEVISGKEYLVNFSGVSENIEKRHIKVFFLNKDREIVDVQFINEVPEEDKSKWNDYQQLVKAPEDSVYMQLQIWARGNKEKKGSFNLKNYYIIPYDEMILLDNIYFLEAGEGSFFDTEPASEKISYERTDSMKRKVYLENPENNRLLVAFGESPNPLWKESYEGQRVDMIINGVAAGFFTDKNGSGEIAVVQRLFYYIGLVLFFTGILVFLAMRMIYKRRIRRSDRWKRYW